VEMMEQVGILQDQSKYINQSAFSKLSLAQMFLIYEMIIGSL